MYPLTIDDNVYLINEDKIIQFKNGDLMVKVIKSEVSLIEAICLAAIEHRPVTILQSYAGGLPNVHWGNRKLNTNDCSYTVDQYAFPADFSFANLRGGMKRCFAYLTRQLISLSIPYAIAFLKMAPL